MPEKFFENEYARFLRETFSSGKSVGAIAPSSPALASKMLEPIDLEKARLIVELGPGTGVFTRALLARMHPAATLLALETNANFRRGLERMLDPRLQVYAESATELGNVLRQRRADAIVSGIPLALLHPEEKQRLLRAVREHLTEAGTFTQFQYSLESYRALKASFSSVTLSFTARNLPPAIIYTCRP